MPYKICKSIEVENGHMLSKHPDKCKYPHGHTRKVEFVLEADSLDQNEMVCDFKIIKTALGEWLDSYDHAMCINTQDPAYEQFKEMYGERVIGFENMDEVSSKPEYATALGLVLLDNERRITRRKDVMDNPLSRLCNKFIDKIHTVM